MNTNGFDHYQLAAARTAIYPGAGDDRSLLGLYYAVMGLVGEAGEIANKAKKILRDNQGVITDQHRQILADELSDVLWYVSALATQLDFPLADVADYNITKLKSRDQRGVLQGAGDGR